MTSLGQFLPKPCHEHVMASSKHRKHDKVCSQATGNHYKAQKRSKCRHTAGWTVGLL